MSLTPNDIRNYEFPTQLRGYDKDEVDSFLEQVAAALEQARQENLKLSMELEAVKGQLAGLKQFEDTIKSAAIDARRNADATVATAKAEAEKILAQARAEADKMIAARTEQIAQLENQMSKLEMARRSYVKKLRSTIESHLEIIDEIISEEAVTQAEADVKRRRGAPVEVVDSTEVEVEKRETIATPPSPDTAVKTEEANAPDPSLDPATVAAEAETETEPEPQIDPEIEQALKEYQSLAASTPERIGEETPIAPRPPKPGEVVETTARAEDIPPGFVAVDPEQDPEKDKSTDKVRVQTDNQPAGSAPAETPADTTAAPEEDLSSALDEVAAKFEEEMDKAAKS